MKGITARFFRLAALGKLAIVILSLMGFVSVVNASNQNTPTTPPPETQAAPKAVEKPESTSEEDIVTEVIPYSTVAVGNPTLEKGKTRVKVQGVNGVMTSLYYRALVDGVEVSRLHISSEVTTEPVNEVVEVGTLVASVPNDSHGDDRNPGRGHDEEVPEPEVDPEPVTPPSYCEDSIVHRDRTERRICEHLD